MYPGSEREALHDADPIDVPCNLGLASAEERFLTPATFLEIVDPDPPGALRRWRPGEHLHPEQRERLGDALHLAEPDYAWLEHL